ncbi:gamma-aminobutyric acid type B receptor subunit 2-like [Glandiceps talaboti]
MTVISLLILISIVRPLSADKTTLYIGGVIESVSTVGGNEDIHHGTKEALDFVNRQPNILPGFELVMLQNYTKRTDSDQAQGLHMLYDFIYNKPQLLMLFTGTSSRVSHALCEAASYYNLVQVSATASSMAFSDKSRFPLFLRTYPPDDILTPAWEALLRNFNWKKVAIIFENIEIFTLLMKDLVATLHSKGGYEILTVEHTESSINPVSQLQSIKNHDARIIITFAYEEMARRIMCQAYHTNQYGQKYVWMLLGWLNIGWYYFEFDEKDVNCTADELITAVDGYIGVKVPPYAKDFDDVNFNGVKPDATDVDVYRDLQSQFYYAGFAYDAVITMALALNHSIGILSNLDVPRQIMDYAYGDVAMATMLRDSVRQLEFFGITGPIRYLETGDRVSEVLVEQMQGVQDYHIGRFDIAKDMFIWHNDSSFKWHGKIPPTDGVEVIHVAALPTQTLRFAGPIMLSLGLSLTFGALFMKTYRVYAIFKIAMKKFKQIRVGDSRLITGVVAMVTFDMVIAIAWIVIDPMYDMIRIVAVQEFSDENAHDFVYIYESRSCNSVYSLYWTIGLYIYKCILLLLGVFLAWEIRSVQVAALNESRQIALSIYVVALVAFISAPVQYFIDDVSFLFAFTGFAIFLATSVVLCTAFVPLIITLRRNPDEVKTSIMQYQMKTATETTSIDRLRNKLDESVQKLASEKMLYGRLYQLMHQDMK